MIRINLLPPEYVDQRKKQEQQILFGGLGGVLVLILLLIFSIKHFQESSLKKDVETAKADLNHYQNIVAQIESIEKSKQQLIGKRNVIRELNRSRLIYPVFFEDLLPVIPGDVWIDQMDITEGGANLAIKSNCNALSNYALASLLTNLNESKHFNNVQFGAISYSRKSTGGPPTLKFTLEFSYRHQGPFPLEEYY